MPKIPVYEQSQIQETRMPFEAVDPRSVGMEARGVRAFADGLSDYGQMLAKREETDKKIKMGKVQNALAYAYDDVSRDVYTKAAPDGRNMPEDFEAGYKKVSESIVKQIDDPELKSMAEVEAGNIMNNGRGLFIKESLQRFEKNATFEYENDLNLKSGLILQNPQRLKPLMDMYSKSIDESGLPPYSVDAAKKIGSKTLAKSAITSLINVQDPDDVGNFAAARELITSSDVAGVFDQEEQAKLFEEINKTENYFYERQSKKEALQIKADKELMERYQSTVVNDQISFFNSQVIDPKTGRVNADRLKEFDMQNKSLFDNGDLDMDSLKVLSNFTKEGAGTNSEFWHAEFFEKGMTLNSLSEYKSLMNEINQKRDNNEIGSDDYRQLIGSLESKKKALTTKIKKPGKSSFADKEAIAAIKGAAPREESGLLASGPARAEISRTRLGALMEYQAVKDKKFKGDYEKAASYVIQKYYGKETVIPGYSLDLQNDQEGIKKIKTDMIKHFKNGTKSKKQLDEMARKIKARETLLNLNGGKIAPPKPKGRTSGK